MYMFMQSPSNLLGTPAPTFTQLSNAAAAPSWYADCSNLFLF